MSEPRIACAALHPGLIRAPGRAEVPVEPDPLQPRSRWREDLRFFVNCYVIALAGFLLLLG